MPMYAPENNRLVLDALEQVVARYPYLNCFIYDRACKIQDDVRRRKRKLWKITTYTTDKFHGKGRKNTRNANPYSHPRLMARLAGLNASIAEQTFSWFRGYARSFNELRTSRRRFLVLLYAKRHNELLRTGKTTHLNRYSHTKRKRGGHPLRARH